MEAQTRNERQILRAVICGFSLGYGGILASVESMQATADGYTVQITLRTLITFCVGAAIMVPCFKMVFQSRRKGARRAALVFVTFVGIASFLYPLRFLPRAAMPEILGGLAAAAVALSVVGGLLLMIRRFLSADERQSGGPLGVDAPESDDERNPR